MKPKSKKEAKGLNAYIGTKEYKHKSQFKKKIKRLASKARRTEHK